MKLLKTILLWIILQVSSSTVCSQTTSNDSICFSNNQAKKIMKDLKRLSFCDSVAEIQALKIYNFEDMVAKDFEIIDLNNDKIKRQNNKIKVLKMKLKISFVGVPVALLGGFVVGTALSK